MVIVGIDVVKYCTNSKGVICLCSSSIPTAFALVDVLQFILIVVFAPFGYLGIGGHGQRDLRPHFAFGSLLEGYLAAVNL